MPNRDHIEPPEASTSPAAPETPAAPPRRPPTPAAYERWWNALPRGDYRCSICGKVDSMNFVQPVHPFHDTYLGRPWEDSSPPEFRPEISRPHALCLPCRRREQDWWKAERKAVLARRPKCEACEKRPATYTAAGSVDLCGRCLKKAQRNHQRSAASLGGLGLFLPARFDRESILRLAKERP